MNFVGSIDCLCLFNCNFSEIKIDGDTYALGYESALEEYRTMIYINKTTSITFVIPVQATLGGESYYYIGSSIMGNLTPITKGIKMPYSKSLVVPAISNTTNSGQILRKYVGKNCYEITIERNPIPSVDNLNIFREINRRLGKTGVIVFYEGAGEQEKVYMCRRTNNLSYTESRASGWEEKWDFREIT